jgi:C_GCAxxG_C_C family probable redox protein
MDQRETAARTVDEAVALFRGGFTCAQALFAAFAPRYGLAPDAALRIATPFGGGVAGEAETCGAVNGALLVLGLARGRARLDGGHAKEETYRLTRAFRERFAAGAGSLVCRDLLRCDISTPGGLREAREAGLFERECPEYVRHAAEILDELLAAPRG